MAAPIAIPIAKLLAYLAKIGVSAVAAKTIAKKAGTYASKHALGLGITGAYVGHTALGEYGKGAERELTREQLQLQTMMAGASAEATKRATLESKKKTKEYTKSLLAARREERTHELDESLIQSFMQSQDRQMMMALQAIQTQAAPRTGGMSGVLRSSF